MYLQSLEENLRDGAKKLRELIHKKMSWKTGWITAGGLFLLSMHFFTTTSLRDRLLSLETKYTKLNAAFHGYPRPMDIQHQQEELTDLRSDLTNIQGQYVQLNEEYESLKLITNNFRQSQALLAETSQRVSKVENMQRREVQKPIVTFEPKIEPKITIPAKPPELTADIIVKSVSVYSTKANGSAWDDSGDPDLKVSISVDGFGNDSGVTYTKKNRTYADFDEKVVTVEEGDTITVKVIDSDLAFDDVIATYSKKVTSSTIRAGSADWSFGRVRSLRLKFEP